MTKRNPSTASTANTPKEKVVLQYVHLKGKAYITDKLRLDAGFYHMEVPERLARHSKDIVEIYDEPSLMVLVDIARMYGVTVGENPKASELIEKLVTEAVPFS